MNRRQERRIQRAIDELIKIQDDGYGTEKLARILDQLNSLEVYYSCTSKEEIKKNS